MPNTNESDELSPTKTKTRRSPAKAKEAPEATGVEDRKTVKVSVREVFGLDMGYQLDDNDDPITDKKGNPIPRDIEVDAYTERTPWVPKIDKDYVFPVEETKILLLGLELKDRILITGETGTGKTSIIEQVCALLNYQLVKINFDGCITRQDLIGEWIVKGKNMEFQYGILVKAFQMPGTVIVLDEWDTISDECSFVLQRPLQKDDGKILILETGGELIPLHPHNSIVATANTVGQGDDTGLYGQGTKVQNYAQLNRFGMTIKMTYLDEDKETEMIKKRFPELEDHECAGLVRAVNEVRDSYANGAISVPLSPRDLINWAEKYLLLGKPVRSAKYAFLNRMTDVDAQTTENILNRVFDIEE